MKLSQIKGTLKLKLRTQSIVLPILEVQGCCFWTFILLWGILEPVSRNFLEMSTGHHASTAAGITMFHMIYLCMSPAGIGTSACLWDETAARYTWLTSPPHCSSQRRKIFSGPPDWSSKNQTHCIKKLNCLSPALLHTWNQLLLDACYLKDKGYHLFLDLETSYFLLF